MVSSARSSAKKAPRHSKSFTSLRRNFSYFIPACSRSESSCASKRSNASWVRLHLFFVNGEESKASPKRKRETSVYMLGKFSTLLRQDAGQAWFTSIRLPAERRPRSRGPHATSFGPTYQSGQHARLSPAADPSSTLPRKIRT